MLGCNVACGCRAEAAPIVERPTAACAQHRVPAASTPSLRREASTCSSEVGLLLLQALPLCTLHRLTTGAESVPCALQSGLATHTAGERSRSSPPRSRRARHRFLRRWSRQHRSPTRLSLWRGPLHRARRSLASRCRAGSTARGQPSSRYGRRRARSCGVHRGIGTRLALTCSWVAPGRRPTRLHEPRP